MKILLIYDSKFGNTKKVSQEIINFLAKKHDVNLLFVSDFLILKVIQLETYDSYILGSPTHGGQASELMREVIAKFSKIEAQGQSVACFDTRSASSSLNLFLKILVKIIGYAGPKMFQSIKKNGFDVVIEAQGFEVYGKKGPLLEDQASKIESWCQEYLRQIN